MTRPEGRDVAAELDLLRRQVAIMDARLRALEPPVDSVAYLRELAARTVAGDRTALQEHRRRMQAREGGRAADGLHREGSHDGTGPGAAGT